MDIDEVAIRPSPPKRRKVLPMVARQTASDILSSWGALKSPTSVSKMNREATARGLRSTKPTTSYAESPPSSTKSSFSIPDYEDARETRESPVDVGDDEEEAAESADELTSDDVIHAVPRGTLARQEQERSHGTRTLPARSTRSNVSYVRPAPKKASPRNPTKRSNRILTSDTALAHVASYKPKPQTARNRVRQDIAAQTKPRRDAFLHANRDYFVPLLPINSYIAKLERINHAEAESEEIMYRSLAQQPDGVTATMKPYQLEGLSFLLHMFHNGMSCILGDEMGLGKTLQTLSLFQYLAENHPTTGEHRPYLVVCPLSVLSSWLAETKRWVPGLKVARFHGPKAERDRLMKDFQGNTNQLPDVIVTTYDTFKSEQGWFKRAFVWRYCVLDEGHMVKNEKSGISAALQGLSAEYRLLLTGTPLQNNLREMWALLHWLFPQVFTVDTEEMFRKAFDLTKGKVSTTFMDSARRLLELIMLRRMKSSPGVNLGLPPKEEVLLYVPLTPTQRFWYTRLLTRENNSTLNDLFAGSKDKEARALETQSKDEQLALFEKAEAALANAEEVDTTDVWAESRKIMQEALQSDEADQKTNAWQKLMNLLMQLRKVCNHPYLLPNAAPSVYEIGDHIKHASGKFIVLDKLLDELVLRQGKKVLIFSGFTRTLDLVGELLNLKGATDSMDAPFRFARLDGRTSRAQRNLSIRMFNEKSSEYKVMLLSTRAGGLGINLTSATDVVFMDEDWNPQATIQAEARAHRIGQTQKVTVYKLCSQGTVEEQMLGRIRKKLYLSAKITESMRNIHNEGSAATKRKRQSTNLEAAATADNDDAPHLDTASLQSLIRRGAQTLARPEIDVTEMLGWDWETVLENCKDKPVDAPEVQGAAVDEQAWLNSMEKVETAVFEGKKHQKEIEKKVEEIAELNRNARRVGKNTTVEIGGFMISKESLNCADWEAVPTFAGKDPRLAEPKREKKKAINHQEFCQCCWDGGELVLCVGCPRSYHRKCLSTEHKRKSMGMTFYCPQHECRDCGAKTSEAGGLIFRCRWCESGFCEDCLDWNTARRVGFTLPELEMLGFGYVSQAYFIDCHRCVEHFNNSPADRATMRKEKLRYEREYQAFVASVASVDSTSGAERTPDTISEAVTPAAIEVIEIMDDDKPLLPHAHPASQLVRKKVRHN